MAMPIADANAVNTLIEWAMGRRMTADGRVITDEDATAAARRLTRKAFEALAAGLKPEWVNLSASRATRERLIRLANQPGDGLDLADQLAIGRVLDVLDRIDRKAATAAGTEGKP
jgi:hypothetical protein